MAFMAKLEDLTVGSNVSGLINNEIIQVVAVKWCGTSVLELTYKNTQGMLANQLLYRELLTSVVLTFHM